jgi:hypothetical protein
MLSKPRETEKDGLYRMDLLGRQQNKVGNFNFCDAGSAHIIYPSAGLSLTLALWSRVSTKGFLSSVRKNPLIQNNKARLLKAVRLFKLSGALQINEVLNFDFVPEGAAFRAMPSRLQYPYSSNRDHVNNLIYLMMAVRCDGSFGLVRDVLRERRDAFADAAAVESVVSQIEAGASLAPIFSPAQQFVAGLNVKRDEVLEALGLQATDR